ncbi:hypothetical protein KY319_05105 [Candidatus Woesearchaeota archaeon]|nr:hypothetical protein [Candidatus Woesearchaeota archaeon]
MANNWLAKFKRTLTCFLPVSKDRSGKCVSCGACCMLPNRCPFLRFKGKKSFCLIYPVRPLNCRKYPRTKGDLLTEKSCGYRFK